MIKSNPENLGVTLTWPAARTITGLSEDRIRALERGGVYHIIFTADGFTLEAFEFLRLQQKSGVIEFESNERKKKLPRYTWNQLRARGIKKSSVIKQLDSPMRSNAFDQVKHDDNGITGPENQLEPFIDGLELAIEKFDTGDEG